MTALRKTLPVEEEPVAATTVARAPVAKLYLVTDTAPAKTGEAATETAGSVIKNIALFLLAPFIGLAYTVALPFVALGVLAVLAGRATAKYEAVRRIALALKYAGLFVVAPVIGLAYTIFFPVIGLGTLAWMGGRVLAGAT